MSHKWNLRWMFALALLGVSIAERPAAAEPLTIGYSDWPGWVAWQVAIDKGWIKQAGLDVKFQWFDYSASMDAFSRRQARRRTDDQWRRAGHRRRRRQERHDHADRLFQRQRHDRRPSRASRRSKDLKGKKVGIEVGLVEHLLLLHGLAERRHEGKGRHAGQRQDQRDAAGAGLRPGRRDRRLAADSGQAMKARAGFAADLHLRRGAGPDLRRARGQPGQPRRRTRRLDEAGQGLGQGRAYINDPKTQDDAVKIMAGARRADAGRTTSRCSRAPICSTSPKARRSSRRPTGSDSLYGSTKIADDFNVDNEVYKKAQDVDSYIDPSLTDGQVARERSRRTSAMSEAGSEVLRSRCCAARAARCWASCPSCCRSLVWCLVSYVPVRLASAGADHRSGRRRLSASRACGWTRHDFDDEVADARERRQRRRRRAMPANPIYLPAPHEVAQRVLHRLHHAARSRRTANGCIKACGTASRSSSGAS